MYYLNRKGERVSVEQNTSGMSPVEDKVLLLPDKVTERVGGIYKPDVVQAQEQLAQVRALLVAIGGNAFEDWGEPIPKEGDRVMVCKYAGILDILGADDLTYQLCTDRDITAILVEDPSKTTFFGTRQPLGKVEVVANER
jgi:co-chaperonin GroES (HSP10)